MNYTQLRAFDAVARAGSLSRAAAALGVSQPAVTIQVKTLETAHGTRLFRREGRGVALTQDGRGLFALTRDMFLAEERVQAFLQEAEALDRASLLLAADGPHVALDLVAAFRRRHPAVRVAMRLGNTEATLRELQEQRVDAAVMANPPDDPRTVVVPVCRRGMLALLPQGHALGAARSLTLREIAVHPVVLREPGSTTRRLLDAAAARAKVVLQPALELGSREAMREAVARGLGIGFLFERESVGDDRTLAVPLPELAGSNLDAVVSLQAQSRRAVVKAFAAVARDWARDTLRTAEPRPRQRTKP